MSCDHKLITEHAYDYVVDNLPAYVKIQCDEVLQQCTHCQQTIALTRELSSLSEHWEDQPVPAWSRVQHLVRPPVSQSYWQHWAALACSVFAVVLVLLQVEITINNGLTISFGGTQVDARVQALLTQELENFAAQQNLSLDQQLDEYMEFQDLNNQVVLNEWLELNRQEREADLNFLLSGWQSQRLQDSHRVNQQLDILTENQLDNNAYLNQIIRNVGLTRGGNL